MKILLLIIAIALIIFCVKKYNEGVPWYEICEVNSKHPDWHPYCGINFLKKDPQWFIDNGYSEYVNVRSIFKR